MTDSDSRTNTVAVGAANGSSVGVTASTIDGTNGTVTYSLIGGASPFVINGSTGVVTVGDSSQITGSATSYTITVQATDGSLTTTGTYTIGVTYPTLMLANDTGSSNSDKVTSVATLTGTGLANATVTIQNGSTILGTTTASSTGAWSFTPTGLGDGSVTLTASESNSGGTVGTASLTFTLDTTVPSIGMALANDTGASNSDHITSSAALTGTGDANATVVIRNGSTVIGTTTASGTGAWSFSPTGLADGTYTLTASETDLAGNTGTGSFGFTLDTTAPKPFINVVTGNGDGGITLTGVAEANSTVSVTDTAGGTMSGSTSTIINIGSGKTITLNGIAPSQFTSSDFVYS